MIHVEQNLHVIAEKPNRLQNQGPSRLRQAIESRVLFHARPNPWPAARALALESEPPSRNLREPAPPPAPPYAAPPPHRGRRPAPAKAAALRRPHPQAASTVRRRNAVCGKQHRNGLASLGAELANAGRSRSANASASSGCCAQPAVKSIRSPPASASTARR